MIVGVSLTQLAFVPDRLNSLSVYLSDGFGGFPAEAKNQIIVMTLMIVIYFFLAGFFTTYIWTRFYLAGLFCKGDDNVPDGT